MLCIASFLIFYLISSSNTYAQNECPISYQCNNTLIKDDDKVGLFCTESLKQKMTGRCCRRNDTIIGLDLRYCDVRKFNISHKDFSVLEILDLRENNFDKFSRKDLLGMLELNFLYLPTHIPCPGGKTAWNYTLEDNSTTTCSYQLDYCKSLNISCGDEENALCNHLGPGSAKCICNTGYFGYKCLNQGVFPTTLFIPSVVIPMIILSIVLWFVQGRDVYRNLPPKE